MTYKTGFETSKLHFFQSAYDNVVSKIQLEKRLDNSFESFFEFLKYFEISDRPAEIICTLYSIFPAIHIIYSFGDTACKDHGLLAGVSK